MKNFIFNTILMFVEILLLLLFKNQIIAIIPIFSLKADIVYDDILVGLFGAVLLTILQECNYYIFIKQDIVIKQIICFVIFSISKISSMQIKNAVQKMLIFIASTEVKWGVTQKSKDLKVANTAEGLLAIVTAYENGIMLSEDSKKTVKNVTKRMLLEVNGKGYQSYNVKDYTVHCSGMMLYVLKKVIDNKLYEVSDIEYEQLHDAAMQLLNSASDYGWGFINNKVYDDIDMIRLFSTIWALRALNIWGFAFHSKFIKTLNNIFINFPDGKLGFAYNSEAKVSTTALLLILISEIKDEQCSRVINKYIDNKTKKEIVNYLLKKSKTKVEVEEYLTDKKGQKKLAWTHISIAFSVQAISIYTSLLSKLNFIRLCLNVRNMIRDIDIHHYYYSTEALNLNHNDPLFYPTTYIIVALCFFMKSDLINNELNIPEINGIR